MLSSIDVLPRRAWLAALCCVALFAGCASAPPPMPKEEKIATLKKAGFAPAGDSWEISLGVKLLFDTDVDSLSDDGRAAVSNLSRTLRDLGIDKYNAALSMRRAESVAQYLRVVGWRDDAIERRGFGADKPVADNATPT